MIHPFAHNFYAVPPKPVQRILSQGVEATEKDQSSKIPNGVSCVCSEQTNVCSSSPVRGGVTTPVVEVTLSPVKRPRGVPNLMTSPVFGCTSPVKRNKRSPLRERDLSPARLSPRNQSPLAGKLRTPSPVQQKVGSYSPGRKSKSWLGFQRAPSAKIEGQEFQTLKSLSVPDLIVYLDDRYSLGFFLCCLFFVFFTPCDDTCTHDFSGFLQKRLKYLL